MRNVSYIPYWKSLLRFIADKNTNWKPKAGVVLAVLYLIWPVDFIPDFIPILGWLDDIGVTALAALYLTYTVSKYLSESNSELRTPAEASTNSEFSTKELPKEGVTDLEQ